MMVNETFFIILTWVCVGVIMCYPYDLPKPQSDGKVHYCGSQLSNTLAWVCRGNYNSMENKRSLRQKRSSKNVRFPFKNHEEAKSFIKVRRRRRGVSDECCLKPCTMDELLTFCK